MQFFKYFMASFLALLAFIFIGFFIVGIFGAIAAASGGGEKSIEDKSFLTIDLSKGITEQYTPESYSFNGSTESSYGLYEMLRAIEHAKTDKNIIGIYLKCSYSMNGWSTSNDLRKALLDFKQSKKKVIAFGDYIDQKTLYIASAADSIFCNPIAGVEFKGLAATSMFYKGALDKLDVTPEIFYCGKFKGASEPYRLDKFSEPNKQQIGAVLQDLSDELFTVLQERTGKTREELNAAATAMSSRKVSGAIELGIIDGARYEYQVLNTLKKLSGVNEKYAARLATMSAYSKTVPATKGDDKIAVLFAEGEIADGKGDDGIYSTTIIKDIRAIANNDKIKALVLRVNSPGGSALASENIYQELMQLHKKKPIIVSMGDVAGSGGYYIACAGDSIYANKNTITGSIGVVGIMFNFQDFLKNKIGVTSDVVKTHAHADLPTVTRVISTEEHAMIQESLDSMYITFKTRVSNARKIDMAAVEELAQGHIYSGTDAIPLKLTDGNANLQQCIAKAAGMAKSKSYKVVTYPTKKDGITAMLEKFTNPDGEAQIKELLGEEYAVYKHIKSLKANANKLQVRVPWDLDIR
jgi:protease IV